MLTIIIKVLLSVPEHCLHNGGGGRLSSFVLMCLILRLEGAFAAPLTKLISKAVGEGGSRMCLESDSISELYGISGQCVKVNASRPRSLETSCK